MLESSGGNYLPQLGLAFQGENVAVAPANYINTRQHKMNQYSQQS